MIALVIVFIVIGGIFVATQRGRKDAISNHMITESRVLYDYVTTNCVRVGMSNQEAQKTAADYMEDFGVKCFKQINMTWGNLFSYSSAGEEAKRRRPGENTYFSKRRLGNGCRIKALR